MKHWKESTQKMTRSYVSTWDKQWPTGCVWTTWGPCSDQPVDRNLWDTPLRCCLAKQTPLPSPPLTQSAETLTGGPARNLYWQAATTNQSTEGMPGSCMRTLRKIWFAVWLFSHFQYWGLDFLGQCEHSGGGWSTWKEDCYCDPAGRDLPVQTSSHQTW